MRLALPLTLAALFAVGGCSKGSFSERKTEQTGSTVSVFRYPIVTNPTSLDPGIVQDGDTLDLLQQVYEGLVTWGEDNEVKPLLAESWTVTPDGKTYTFTLKKGVKFHNGREVTAEDFKWSFERNCDPGFQSPTAVNYLSDIVGIVEKSRGTAKEIRGIQVVDPYTLKIEIDQPRAYFLGKLTYLVSSVLPKEVAGTTEINNADRMVGTGPFKVDQYVPEQITALVANADYHGGAPAIARLERPVIKDPATRLNKFKAKELDLVMLERQDVPGLKESEWSGQLKFFDRPSIFYIGLNQGAYAPFKDRRVRRAIAMAIDKEKIVNETMGGINNVANSIVPPGVMFHRPDAAAIKYDPEGAKKLLAEAGFADASKMPPLEMRFREQRPDIRLVAEAVASQLETNLGIKTTLRTMEWRSYLELWNQGKIGFFHMRWAADYLDAQNFLSHMLSTTGPENKIGYNNPEFDRLCAEADTTLDRDKRAALYAQAEDIALQDAPWIPIYFQRDAELISPAVQGLRESLFGHLPHTTVRIAN